MNPYHKTWRSYHPYTSPLKQFVRLVIRNIVSLWRLWRRGMKKFLIIFSFIFNFILYSMILDLKNDIVYLTRQDVFIDSMNNLRFYAFQEVFSELGYEYIAIEDEFLYFTKNKNEIEYFNKCINYNFEKKHIVYNMSNECKKLYSKFERLNSSLDVAMVKVNTTTPEEESGLIKNGSIRCFTNQMICK